VTLGSTLLLPPSSLWDHLSKANGYRVSESLARSHQGGNLRTPRLPESLPNSPSLALTSPGPPRRKRRVREGEGEWERKRRCFRSPVPLSLRCPPTVSWRNPTAVGAFPLSPGEERWNVLLQPGATCWGTLWPKKEEGRAVWPKPRLASPSQKGLPPSSSSSVEWW